MSGLNPILRVLAGPLLRRWHSLRDVEDTYDQLVMNAEPPGTAGAWHALMSRYRSGGPLPRCHTPLDKFAHDFIIPSVAQALYTLADRPPASFLGNVVNRRATHVSGAAPRGCDSDVPAVKAMLRDIGQRLS